MEENKEGKEKQECSTIPNVLIRNFKIRRTVSAGQEFSVAEVEYEQSGIPDCSCGSYRLIHCDS